MVNKCYFIGNLTRDPEFSQTQTGSDLCKFTIACNEKYKKNGETVENVEFVNCVAFGKLAGIVSSYTSKGSKVFAMGKLNTNKYEKDGQTRYYTSVIVNEFTMLDSKNSVSDKEPVFLTSHENTEADPWEEVPF